MIWLLWMFSAQATQLSVEPALKVRNSVVVQCMDRGRPCEGKTVSVVLRPDLSDSQELAIGVTDSRGRVRWTPDRSGVAELRADNARLRVAIPWPRPPSESLLLMVLLLATCLGSAWYGLRKR
jgi:hypothetical protein